MASASAACRVPISGDCFAFSSSMSASMARLQPYLPCLWVCQFSFKQFIPALPPLPYVHLEFAQTLVKEYQTLSCSIGITSLSTTPSFLLCGISYLTSFLVLAHLPQVKESFIAFLYINLPHVDFLIFLQNRLLLLEGLLRNQDGRGEENNS